MSTLAKVLVDGIWKDIANPQIRSGGVWKSVSNGFVMKNGTWQSVLSSGGGSQSYSDFILSKSPDLYLKFDETSGAVAVDASGTYPSGGSYTSSSDPVKGVAAQEFIRAGNTCPQLTNGSGIILLPSDFVPNSYSVIPTTGSFIWDFWMKLGTYFQTSRHVITCWTNSGYSFSIDFQGNNMLRTYITAGSGVWNLTGTTAIGTEWNHYSIVFNNNVLTQYLNGVQDGTLAVGGFGNLNGSTYPIQIGNFDKTTTADLELHIDELAFFRNNDWITPLANKAWWLDL